MISIAIVLRTLVLLALGVTCLARPDTIQEITLRLGRAWGREDSWRRWLLTTEFLYSVRVCGLVLLFNAALLALALR